MLIDGPDSLPDLSDRMSAFARWLWRFGQPRGHPGQVSRLIHYLDYYLDNPGAPGWEKELARQFRLNPGLLLVFSLIPITVAALIDSGRWVTLGISVAALLILPLMILLMAGLDDANEINRRAWALFHYLEVAYSDPPEADNVDGSLEGSDWG